MLRRRSWMRCTHERSTILFYVWPIQQRWHGPDSLVCCCPVARGIHEESQTEADHSETQWNRPVMDFESVNGGSTPPRGATTPSRGSHSCGEPKPG